MSVAAQSIMLGFGIIAALFTYIGFRMNESEEYIQQIFGYFFFSLALIFINIIAFTALQIADNEGVTYLISGAIEPAITIVVWALVLFTVIVLIQVMFNLVMYLAEQYNERKRAGWRKL